MLRKRGYCPTEFTSVLYRDLATLPELPATPLPIRPIGTPAADARAQVAAGWLTGALEFAGFLQDLGQTSA